MVTRYLDAYARQYKLLPSEVHVAGEDIYRHVGAIYFEFRNSSKELVLRSTIIIDASDINLDMNKDLRAALDKIAKEEPAKVNGGIFEVTRLVWERHSKPSLFLTKIVRNPNLSTDQFVQLCDQFARTAYQWHRLYFHEVAQEIIRSRRAQQNR